MVSTRRVRIFVASPGDVSAERDAVGAVVADLNNTLGQTSDMFVELVRWETHGWPGFGQDAQDVINDQIAPYDVFLGIMWARLGTPTARAPSGTVEEFVRAYEQWRLHGVPHLMFYFCRVPFEPDTPDAAAQFESVQRFERELSPLGAFCWPYRDVTDFRRTVYVHLYRHLTQSAPREMANFQWHATLKYGEGHRRIVTLRHQQGVFELDFKYRYVAATAKINGVNSGRQLTLSGPEQGCAFQIRLPDGRTVPGRVTYTIFLPRLTYPTFAVWLDDQCVYSEDNRIFKRD